MNLKKKDKITFIIIGTVILILVPLGFFGTSYGISFLEGENISTMDSGMFELTDEIRNFDIYSDSELILIPVDDDDWGTFDADYSPLERETNDYLKIAKMIFSAVWDGSIDGWEISQINVDWVSDGPVTSKRNVGFQFFYEETDGRHFDQFRYVFKINFSPQTNRVSWYIDKYQPRWFHWESISTEGILSAEQVLELVEFDSGTEWRNNCDSECVIATSLSEEYWRITYSCQAEDSDLSLTKFVNSISGEIKE